MDVAFYTAPGPLTALTPEQAVAVQRLGLGPEALCRAVQGLVVFPDDAFGAGLSEERMAERNTRPATALLQRVADLDPAPLDHPRDAERRVVGTCRHVAVLATAMLRATGIPARARCGFASYFVASKYVDHWVAEHWSVPAGRWVRVDPEVVDLDAVHDPCDLQPGEFLTGGEAWQQVRIGEASASDFGVTGTDNWGPGEVRGNAIRDLAALNKVEMLPWDEWGPMADSYDGTTDDHFDAQIDVLAGLCAGDDLAALRRCYERFAVPADLIA